MGERTIESLLSLAREKRKRENGAAMAAEHNGAFDFMLEMPQMPEKSDSGYSAFDSELYERLLFEEKYFICNDGWKDGKNEEAVRRTRMRQEQLVEERVSNLFSALVKDGALDGRHGHELKFLLENFYDASEYAKSIDRTLGRVKRKERIARILRAVESLIYSAGERSAQEIRWEINKYFCCRVRATFENCVCDFEDNVRAVSDRLLKTDDRVKDILLARIKTDNITHRLGISSKQAYFDRFEKEYDEERITKDGIRILIKSGAKINLALAADAPTAFECDIAERMRFLRGELPKKIIATVDEGGLSVQRWVDNTAENRLKKLYHTVNNSQRVKLTFDGFYELFTDNDDIPREWLLAKVEPHGVGMSDDEKLSLAEKLYGREISLWRNTKRSERVIAELESELADLEERYSRGERTVMIDSSRGEKVDREEAFIKRLSEMTYEQFVSCRSERKTRELLTSLDGMTLSEIRERFFQA